MATRSPCLVTLITAVVLALTGCSVADSPGAPPGGRPKADDVIATLATGLAQHKLDSVPVDGDAQGAQNELETVLKGMGKATPTVKFAGIEYDRDGSTATARLDWSWPFGEKTWTYQTKAPLTYRDGWKVTWTPTIIHPELTARAALRMKRQAPDRGRILGAGGVAIVERREVVRVGVDKSQLTPEQAATSAAALAKVVQVDPGAYVAEVKAAGSKQFVIATTLRASVGPAALASIPGALAQNDVMMLSPYKGFAGNLLGSVGPADAQRVADSKGTIAEGDTVGLSGIQRAMDPVLRGTPGVRVELVKRPDAEEATGDVFPTLLFKQDSVAGKDVVTTIDINRQKKLDALLKAKPIKTAVVVVQPSTGRILAIGNSENASAQQLANTAHSAPGSTFKVITSLAMLRHGLTMDSVTPCPTSVTINGRRVNNYPGYPTSQNGNITLRAALSWSCNTAFAGFTPKLGPKDLQEAAASLGVGVDYDAGFASFFGSIPDAPSEEARMEQTFGQGTVAMSPLAMSAVPASVKAGRTVTPWLIEGKQPTSAPVKPLTAAEAAQLRVGMAGVVAVSKDLMKGLEGAKTGTAQFGTGPQLQSHTWLIGFAPGDLAGAVYQEVGEHSPELGPVLAAALS